MDHHTPPEHHGHTHKHAVARFFEKFGTPIALFLGLVVIAAALYFGHSNPSTAMNGTNPSAAAPTANIKDVKTDGEPYIGNPNAPVTVAFFYDYQCPFCKQFEQQVEPGLYTNYVQTGKVKVVFKDFQFLGQDSQTAAEFGRAVWAAYPAQFYAWYTAMFEAQDQEGDQGFGDLDSIKALTAKIPGIDVNHVVTLMNTNKAAYDAAIAADRSEGATLGVNGTPSVIVGTQLLTGLTPDQFNTQLTAAIKQQL